MPAAAAKLDQVNAQLQQLCRGRAPSAGGRQVATVGVKGQSGKTTAVTVLGTVLASQLAGVTIGADVVNPDKGTLVARAGAHRHPTTRRLVDLAAAAAEVRYPDELNMYLDAVGRFHLLHNEQVYPEAIAEISGEQYAQVLKVLRHFAALTLIDTGTWLIHPGMTAALSAADHLVIAVKASPESLNLTAEGVEDLRRQGFAELVESATVIITVDDPKVRASDFAQAVRFFSRLAGHVEVIDYDPAAGSIGAIDWPHLRIATSLAYARFARAVAQRLFAPYQHPIPAPATPAGPGWAPPLPAPSWTTTEHTLPALAGSTPAENDEPAAEVAQSR